MKTKWHGDKATRVFMAKLGTNINAAGIELALRVRTAISTQGPPRSEPGKPPHMDTQALIASYGHSTDTASLITRVGSDEKHSVYLESGTPKMAQRPHLVSTLIASADDLSRIAAKP